MTDTTTKPVIFLAFANDRDDSVRYLRNLPEEARRLRDILDSAESAGLCEVVVRTNCTADDIFKVFRFPQYRNRIAIFHYGGHATGYQLLLESATGQATGADAKALAAFLGQQRGLRLVFLNGCSTQEQTQGLLDANVSAVVSTARAIDDRIATYFAAQFYQGLASGAGVAKSFAEAEASSRIMAGGTTRGLYLEGDADDNADAVVSFREDRVPWNLYTRDGAEHVRNWNLPDAVNEPLFGLPELPSMELPESPFRHLKWFTREDAHVFFGRGHQIRELYDRLTAQHSAPIVLFYGQSGVGKSSILDAGLMPRLEHDYEVRYLRRDQQTGLMKLLRGAVRGDAEKVPLDTAWWAREKSTDKPLIIILDQVEEIFTRPHPEMPPAAELDLLLRFARATFLKEHRKPRGKLVLAFRKEWLAELEARLIDAELPRTRMFLEPLDRRGVQEVILGASRTERLQRRYGLTIEEGLASAIADDLLGDRDSAIAPTLQILLTKMWTLATEENDHSPRFTRSLYQKLKRDGILLRDFLNQQISEFRQQYPDVVDSGLLIDIVALHTTPLGTAGECSVEQLQQQYAHLGDTLPTLLQRCQDLHLLTVAAGTRRDAPKTTRLAHDTLAPLVRERFDESDRPGQRARRILDNRAVDWENEGKGTPLDAADLTVVEEGIFGTRALTETERRLLEASRRLRDRLRRNRSILRMTGLLAVLAITAAAGVAFWQWNTAVRAKGELQENNTKLVDAKANLEKSNEQLAKATTDAIEARDAAEMSEAVAVAAKSDLEKKNEQLAKATTDAIEARDAAKMSEKTAVDAKAKLEETNKELVAANEAIEKARMAAIVAKDAAVAAQEEAVAAQRETEVALKATQREAFNQQLLRVSDTWRDDPDAAIALLNDTDICPVELRDFTWRLYNSLCHRERMTIRDESTQFQCVTYAPDGRTVVSGNVDGKVQVWDAESGELRRTLEGHDAWIGSIAFIPQNPNLLVTCSADGTACFWNVATGELQKRIGQQGEYNGRLAVSPDGSWIAIARNPIPIDGDNWEFPRVDLLDANTRTISRKIPLQAEVHYLTFTPDSNRLLAVNTQSGGLTSIWSKSPAQSSNELEELVMRGASRLRSVTFAPMKTGADYSLATADSGGIVQVFGRPDWSVTKHPEIVDTIAFSPDGMTLASAGEDHRIILSDGRSTISLSGHTAPVTSLAFSPDGETLVSAGRDGTIRFWDWRVLRETDMGDAVHFASAVSPDGRRFAIGNSKGRIEIRNAVTGQPEATWSGHQGPIYSLAFAPDGRLLSAGGDATVRIWMGRDRMQQQAALSDHTDEVMSVRFSSDGMHFATGSEDGTVRIWNAAGNACEHVLRENGSQVAVRSVSFGKNGVLAAATGEHVVLWNWEDETVIRKLKGHTDRVMDVTFAPGGITLASASADQSIRIWKISTDDPPHVLQGHDAVVSSLAFTDDGESLVSAAWDGSIRIWDTSTSRERTALGSSLGAISSLSFSGDGTRLVSSGSEGFQIWSAGESLRPLEIVAMSPESSSVDRGWQPPDKAAWKTLAGHPGRSIKDGEVLNDKSGITLVAIPAGNFRMGSAQPPERIASDFDEPASIFLDEVPQHDVRITRRFLMGQDEVTRAQFSRFIDDTGYETDAERDHQWHGFLDPTSGRERVYKPGQSWKDIAFLPDQYPVVFVSWNDATAFCGWLSEKNSARYRLPTEAEWEYAARAGSTTRYFSGDEAESLDGFANIPDRSFQNDYAGGLGYATVNFDDGYIELAPAGHFKPNPFGLRDIHGNVWEWCLDRYDPTFYRADASRFDDPVNAEGGIEHVMRGGCYM